MRDAWGNPLKGVTRMISPWTRGGKGWDSTNFPLSQNGRGGIKGGEGTTEARN